LGFIDLQAACIQENKENLALQIDAKSCLTHQPRQYSILFNLKPEDVSMTKNRTLRGWWWQTNTVCPQEPESV